MPNGRSGGFWVETVELKELLKNTSDIEVVGKIVEGPSRTQIRAANAAEVTRLIEECSHDRVGVEEQDHKFYIIHFSEEPKIVWLTFGAESPMFPGIRQRHTQWVAEHRGRG